MPHVKFAVVPFPSHPWVPLLSPHSSLFSSLWGVMVPFGVLYSGVSFPDGYAAVT